MKITESTTLADLDRVLRGNDLIASFVPQTEAGYVGIELTHVATGITGSARGATVADALASALVQYQLNAIKVPS